ncbi:hypothetical protein BDZ45DRAFT_687296 [Acephala macrosclerotiorum]|nr:hypothetical protein BDZ45DRAFT_687296 [Acephala macrosclerotiorum]
MVLFVINSLYADNLKLIAMRYNDVVNGTHVIDDALPKYKAAWAEKGMLSKHGLFRGDYAVRQNKVLDTDEISHSAWVMAFMPWNPEQIQRIHPTMSSSFLQRVDDRINLHAPVVTNAIKDIVTKEGEPNSPVIVKKARNMTAGMKPSRKLYLYPTFGYVSQWSSEIAGSLDLDALLVTQMHI